MRCRPSTRMSLTVKLLSGLTAGARAFAAGWGGAMPNAACGSTVSCAQAAGAVMAVARARTSRRRVGVRVIKSIQVGVVATPLGGRGRVGQLPHEVVQDVVVERQTHESRQQGQADILPRGHRTFA